MTLTTYCQRCRAPLAVPVRDEAEAKVMNTGLICSRCAAAIVAPPKAHCIDRQADWPPPLCKGISYSRKQP